MNFQDDEVFNLMGNVWSVPRAAALIEERGLQPVEIDVSGYATSILALDRSKGWDEQKTGLLCAVDHEFASGIDPDRAEEPGIVVETEHGGLVMDGNHRLAKRYMEGVDRMRVYVITSDLEPDVRVEGPDMDPKPVRP